MSRRHIPILTALTALFVWILPGAPVSAAGTATLVSGTVVPHNPPMDGVMRLDLRVRNDTPNAWAAGDLVHLTWKGADGKPVASDARPLGQAVALAATIDLTLVTLSPTAVGDFTLTTELETRGSRLQIGDPSPFHLSGFLFKGRGNGHGLGMSQWGARGRAAAGDDYKKILAAYYKNSRIDGRDTSGTVRIALTHGPIDLARPWPRVFGALPTVAGLLTVDGYPQLSATAGSVLGFDVSAGGKPEVFLQPASGTAQITVPLDRTLVIRSAGPAGIRTNVLQTMGGDFRTGAEQWRYSGELRIIPKGGATILPVNVLPMEDYLKGVVPAEMPPYWGVEALKAQAIAARTYALRKISAGGGDFDLEGNQFDQAYSGLTEQVKASSDAVDGTKGQVLTNNGQLLSALYMASGGGHTENSEYGFIHWNHGLQPAANLPYLRGIVDPLDRAPSWQVGPFSATDAAQILRNNDDDLGDRLVGIDILQKGPSGRLLGVRLRGSSKTDEISGPVLRAWFGLPDTLVEIVGGG
ncbi:MAG: SpoIID/LytB domain-containing protein [Candidatus Dormibacteraeota bacterium]|nr:SpoIID/LytB domain-containing protein [Candidatus Dormibacteraeota bacterium]